MSLPLAALGEFGDAVQFLFQSRESQAGGAEVGGAQIWGLVLDHLRLSAVALLAAIAVAVPAGLVLGHTGRFGFLAINLSNVGRAVPTLALVAFLVAFLGVGFWNVTFALVLLAIPPILTNTYTGVRQVDPEMVDAARGQGMTGAQVLGRVELPLALPLLTDGVRISTVNVIATATLAPLAGASSLGDPIVSFGVYGDTGRLAGSLLVAALAIGADAGIAALRRALTPRGLRLTAST
ncbi:MAG: ABC transporter permease [Solirubrobacteraceae bacterium]|jgi:osmoprotectant transport system permease protein|nr:ABC transporter permease [Solirubrobacteraceae bacterium]MCU0313017.1 ABC transporter permease [Solirubrobacteraceae bacterium]